MKKGHYYVLAVATGCGFIIAATILQYGAVEACYTIGGAILLCTLVYALSDT